MDNKIIAIFAVAVLAVAGIGVAVFMNSSTDSNDDVSFCDTWYATYTEYVRLDTMEIHSKHYTMDEMKVPLTITSENDFVVTGEWGGIQFQGPFIGYTFTMDVEKYPFKTGDEEYPCYAEVHHYDDRLVVCGSIYDSLRYSQTVAAFFLQYTRQGTTPVGLIDMMKYSDMSFVPGAREVYTESSIKEGKTELAGTSPNLELCEAGNMITLYKVYNDVSYLVMISAGVWEEKVRMGFVIGKLYFEDAYHYVLGFSTLSNNELNISYEQEIGPGHEYIASYSYKTDYPDGVMPTPSISNGTFDVDVKFYRSERDQNEIESQLTVKIVGKAIYMYSGDSDDGHEALMGVMIGNYSQGTFASSVGYFEGSFSDDCLHIVGVIYHQDEDAVFFQCDVHF